MFTVIVTRVFLLSLIVLFVSRCGFPGCFGGHLKNNYLDHSTYSFVPGVARKRILANLSRKYQKSATPMEVVSELQQFGATCKQNSEKNVFECKYFQYLECGSQTLLVKNVASRSEFWIFIVIPDKRDWFPNTDVSVQEKMTIY
jgi:hypothetical protein